MSIAWYSKWNHWFQRNNDTVSRACESGATGSRFKPRPRPPLSSKFRNLCQLWMDRKKWRLIYKTCFRKRNKQLIFYYPCTKIGWCKGVSVESFVVVVGFLSLFPITNTYYFWLKVALELKTPSILMQALTCNPLYGIC